MGITEAKSGFSNGEAARIVKVVRALRDSDSCEFTPTIRGCIMIAKTLRVRDSSVDKDDEIFKEICMEVLASETSRIGSRTNQERVRKDIVGLINEYC
ncbi:MAG: hypothetical protein SVY10_02470 [Thermodesulfobacteriota bacterium]|nr:hypothetical protein [Thermodesulfobacteriota bacterium]